MSNDPDRALMVTSTDERRRFLIESCDVRGDLVRLGDSLREATANTDYPPVIERLLGEAFVSAVLLAGTIKFDGRMTFQVRGDGAVHLLVVQVAADASYRGLARWSGVPAAEATLVDCFGPDARLTITIEARDGAEPYQGIVPLEGDTLADAIAAYFRSSEQLPTELTLEVNQNAASGLLLQRVPAASDPESADEGWARATLLASTLESSELVSLAPDTLLRRLYHEEDVRLLDSHEPRFHCSCSRHRTDGMLTGLGQAEVESILEERGDVEITCEFCDARYCYDAVDVGALFSLAPGHLSGDESLQESDDGPTHH